MNETRAAEPTPRRRAAWCWLAVLPLLWPQLDASSEDVLLTFDVEHEVDEALTEGPAEPRFSIRIGPSVARQDQARLSVMVDLASQRLTWIDHRDRTFWTRPLDAEGPPPAAGPEVPAAALEVIARPSVVVTEGRGSTPVAGVPAHETRFEITYRGYRGEQVSVWTGELAVPAEPYRALRRALLAQHPARRFWAAHLLALEGVVVRQHSVRASGFQHRAQTYTLRDVTRLPHDENAFAIPAGYTRESP